MIVEKFDQVSQSGMEHKRNIAWSTFAALDYLIIDRYRRNYDA